MSPPEDELDVTNFGFVDAGRIFLDFNYAGSGALEVTESETVDGTYTAVSNRTTVSTPDVNRFEFAAPPRDSYFFRVVRAGL